MKNAVITDTGGFTVLEHQMILCNHALDLDNGYIYFGVNGTWQNSGVPTSGATGTGGFSITANTLYHPAVSAFAIILDKCNLQTSAMDISAQLLYHQHRIRMTESEFSSMMSLQDIML